MQVTKTSNREKKIEMRVQTRPRSFVKTPQQFQEYVAPMNIFMRRYVREDENTLQTARESHTRLWEYILFVITDLFVKYVKLKLINSSLSGDIIIGGNKRRARMVHRFLNRIKGRLMSVQIRRLSTM
jgi:hypothetical protein